MKLRLPPYNRKEPQTLHGDELIYEEIHGDLLLYHVVSTSKSDCLSLLSSSCGVKTDAPDFGVCSVG